MKNQTLRVRRMLGIGLAVALTCFAAASALSTKNPSNQESSLPIVNKTKGVEIVNIQLRGGELRLELRNNYSRAITAYALSIDRDESIFSFSEDFIHGNKAIASGEIRSLSIPIPHSESAAYRVGTEQRINLQGVILDDRTSDGDFTSIRSIEDSRSGTRQFLVQALPLITTFVDLPETLTTPDFDSLVFRVASLQVPDATKQSDDVKSGFNNTRELFLRKLDEIKKLSDGTTFNEKLRVFEEDRSMLAAKL